MEGGARCQLEKGRYVGEDEIALKVKIHPCKAEVDRFKHLDVLLFDFKADFTVEQCKSEICEGFGIVKPEEQKTYTLYRVNNFNDPQFPIRKEKKNFESNMVSSGDLIILKSNMDVTAEEKINLSVSVTVTGLPDDCNYLGQIDISKEFKFVDLVDCILTLPYFQDK